MKSDGIRGTATLAMAAVMAAVLCWPGGANAQPDCDAERCSIQTAIDAQCPCDEATNHGDYVRCVRAQVKALASPQCRGKIVRCAAKSTCGKPGFVTCERTGRKGDVRCKVSRSADRCEARGGTVGSGPSCCAACTSSTTTTVVTTTLATTTTTTLYGSPSRAFVGQLHGLLD